MQADQARWTVVWIEAGADWEIVGGQQFRSFKPALAVYREVGHIVGRGMRAMLKRVPGKVPGKTYWSLVEAERFGDWPGLVSQLVQRAGMERWTVAL